MNVSYLDKLDSLKDIFGTSDISCGADTLRVNGRTYPIVDDVIILTTPELYTPYVRSRLGIHAGGEEKPRDFAEDIQFTFGEEWKSYGSILPEHEDEFRRYFDLVDLESFRKARVCDLGCGIGRWSYFLRERVCELVLVDFSDAIFVARRNLASSRNAIYFMADLTRLEFRPDFCDLLFCLGVLHHLPVPCLPAVRSLAKLAPKQLYFLYYALDNRPVHFRFLLAAVTIVRRFLCRIRNKTVRKVVSLAGAILIYKPLVLIGSILACFGLGRFVPLYEFYRGKSIGRIEQDVYDRFFTRIEQRVTRREIKELSDDGCTKVTISDHIPYWHFLVER